MLCLGSVYCNQCRMLLLIAKDEGLDSALETMKKWISRGVSAEHFKPVLDELLGTIEPEQELELDEVWEQGRTRG